MILTFRWCAQQVARTASFPLRFMSDLHLHQQTRKKEEFGGGSEERGASMFFLSLIFLALFSYSEGSSVFFYLFRFLFSLSLFNAEFFILLFYVHPSKLEGHWKSSRLTFMEQRAPINLTGGRASVCVCRWYFKLRTTNTLSIIFALVAILAH